MKRISFVVLILILIGGFLYAAPGDILGKYGLEGIVPSNLKVSDQGEYPKDGYYSYYLDAPIVNENKDRADYFNLVKKEVLRAYPDAEVYFNYEDYDPTKNFSSVGTMEYLQFHFETSEEEVYIGLQDFYFGYGDHSYNLTVSVYGNEDDYWDYDDWSCDEDGDYGYDDEDYEDIDWDEFLAALYALSEELAGDYDYGWDDWNYDYSGLDSFSDDFSGEFSAGLDEIYNLVSLLDGDDEAIRMYADDYGLSYKKTVSGHELSGDDYSMKIGHDRSITITENGYVTIVSDKWLKDEPLLKGIKEPKNLKTIASVKADDTLIVYFEESSVDLFQEYINTFKAIFPIEQEESLENFLGSEMYTFFGIAEDGRGAEAMVFNGIQMLSIQGRDAL